MDLTEVKTNILKIADKMNLVFPENADAPMALDSLGLMMFIYECETAFGIKFDFNDITQDLSVGGLCGLIYCKLG